MDLGAYMQIDSLDELVKKNNIEVPRLRGYRLMKNEEYVDYSGMFANIDIECVEDLCEAEPFWSDHPKYWASDDYTDYLKRFFLEYKDGKPIKVRWERIHGWKRRELKLAIHNKKKRIASQFETWNRYVGRDDILYIHARIGGSNWAYSFREVVGKPWFIEKVDDCFDSTYCDIYARIKTME